VPVIVPGRPGQSASVLPADEIVAPDGSRYAEVDAWFVRMMIPHHTQAVQMATLAPGRARNPWIVAVAERVRAAQLPEIARLKAWLRARGLGEEDPSGHEHGSMQGMSMRGMQSPEALRALAATRDDGFDRMFVAMMCEHHQGAIDMATAVLTVVSNLEVEEMATAIAAEQSSEITRMREVIGG
jgi:uncharacterized protein (DUF305 family)